MHARCHGSYTLFKEAVWSTNLLNMKNDFGIYHNNNYGTQN